MSDRDKKILMGTFLGTAASICAAGLFYAMKSDRKSEEELAINDLEDVIEHLEDALGKHDLKAPRKAAKKTRQSVHKHEDQIESVLGMIAAGIDAWKSFKR